jgi:peptidoglycan/LPS O-acetylase OafA/YrhL
VVAAATQIEVGVATQTAEAATAASARPTAASATARNNFAALRLIAAVLVVYGHQTLDQTGTFGLRLVVFFAISGYLVAGSWHADPHLLRFMARRLLRIWPAYAAVVVVCAAVSYLFPAPDMPEISRLASLFYLSNLWFSGFEWGFFPFRNPFMNQSIWMMRFEVDIYIAFGLIAWFGARLGRRWLPLIAAGLVLAALRAPETHPSPGGLLECWSLYFAGFFAFGVLLREFAWMRRGAVVLLSLAAGVVLLWLGERTAGLLLVIPAAAVWVGERSWPVLRSAGRFGDLSLGIFLWAWPVQQVTRFWLDPALPLAVQFTVVLLQVVALASVSWRLIEAPALRCKPAKPDRRKDFDDLVTA